MTSHGKGERLRMLAEFLRDAFKASELEQMVCFDNAIAGETHAVNWNGPLGDVVYHFIACLESRGEINEKFFHLLESKRPSRADEIRTIRDAWGFPSAARSNGKPDNLPPQSLKDLFVGRGTDLEQLHASLHNSRGGVAALVGKAVHGLGGVGKTRLAVEYARRHADDYSARLFVVADSKASLWQNVSNLAGEGVLNLPARDSTEQEAKVKGVTEWLEGHPGWLLILDNVDSEEVAAEVNDRLMPQLKGGSVLITSRLSWWGNHVEAIELDVLPLDVAVQFLLERTKLRSGGQGRVLQPSDEQDAEALAKELGSLALALEQAGAYIVNQRITIAEYLVRWKKHDAEIHVWTDKRSKEQKSVGTTYQTTLAQLGRQEIAILNLLAWMAPEPIPLFILGADEAWKQRPPEQQPRKAGAVAEICLRAINLLSPGNAERASRGTLRESIGVLADFSMLRWDAAAGTATVHRVVQEILRTRQGEEGTQWLTLTLRLLDAARPSTNPADVRTWPAWDLLRPHVTSAVADADQRQIADPTADLMGRLGTVLWAKALHREAEHWERRALALDEMVHGPDSPQVAVRLNNLAQTLQHTNRLAEAEPLMRCALEIDEQSYGPQHPNVATDLNNLAILLQATNRLEEAEPLMRRALAIDEQSYGPHHPDVAIDFNNLAQLLQETNRLAKAEPLMRRVVEIRRDFFKASGHPHPRLQASIENYRRILTAMDLPGDEINRRVQSALDEPGTSSTTV